MQQNIDSSLSELSKAGTLFLQTFIFFEFFDDGIFKYTISDPMNIGDFPEIVGHGAFKGLNKIIYLKQEHIMAAESGNIVDDLTDMEINHSCMGPTACLPIRVSFWCSLAITSWVPPPPLAFHAFQAPSWSL